ncbi:hypothetical protein GZH53_06435 [Flavihumibacter sp. R14]|nr:hypothetical protein [Flavihumibacter soli]
MSALITAASYSQAYKLERLLNLSSVIFADYQELPQLAYPGKKLMKIPEGNSVSYAHEMLDLALNAGISKIFPLYSSEILPLAEARQLFSEYGISVIVPSILWVKSQNNDIPSLPARELVVLEKGRLLAGDLSSNIIMPESDFTGIFKIQKDLKEPVFQLFTV